MTGRPEAHSNARLEAFCDGVFAFALTLLIIDVRVPAMDSIAGTPELWRALEHLTPSVSAFLLSFVVIFITWVNHHGTLKLVRKSSAPFMYANGFLLLTVVFIPFPTALLGASVLTDHAAPAVALYDAVLAVQAIAWLFLSFAALKGHLPADEQATAAIHKQRTSGYFAFTLYSLLAISAFWFPLVAAIITGITWLVWLTFSIRLKHT